MRRKLQRFIGLIAAAALCFAAPAGAMAAEPNVLWDDAADFSVAESIAKSTGADHGVFAYSEVDNGVSTYSVDTSAVAVETAATTGVRHEASVYNAGDVNVYTAETVGDNNKYTGTDYTVTIPAVVNVDTTSNKGGLKITGELGNCYNLVITIKPTDDDRQFAEDTNGKLTGKMKSEEGAELPYHISENKLVFWKNTNDRTLDGYTVDIQVPETPNISGNYTDILTFVMDAKQYQPTESGTYTLTFDTNALGATDADKVTISTTSKFVQANQECGALPTPRRDFYTFDGWYTEASGGTKVTEKTTFTRDTIVYAHWTAHTMTILYHNDYAERINWGWEIKNSQLNDPSYESIQKNEDGTYKYDSTYIYLNYDKDYVTLKQVETYGIGFSNGGNGLYNASRWYRSGYTHTTAPAGTTPSGTLWRIGEYGTETCGDGDIKEWQNDMTLCAKALGVLEDLKQDNVIVDLYPAWTKTGNSSTQADEWYDAPVVIPSEEETTMMDSMRVSMESQLADLTGDAADTTTDSPASSAPADDYVVEDYPVVFFETSIGNGDGE